ncbi:MAG: DJ-1/PfpI family protein [Deltaproteobacteria bacterium]|nr:DJ-1/PfpI family protein [Deltaproteobacteria bacterium]
MNRKNLAILIFDDMEVMDFAGPFEVFSVTDELSNHELLNVYTVGQKATIRAKNGLKVVPDYSPESCPVPDYLIIPGGSGTRPLLEDDKLLDWIVQVADNCENVLSVCTGSLVLAKAGLLKGLKATTHHEVIGELEEMAPETEIVKDQRFVDNGKILTSAGVAAGIDMSLYMVSRLYGEEMAVKIAKYIEYRVTNN